jgi:hypothetical protein
VQLHAKTNEIIVISTVLSIVVPLTKLTLLILLLFSIMIFPSHYLHLFQVIF